MLTQKNSCTTTELVLSLQKLLIEKKAEEVLFFDIKESNIASYTIIASAFSERQVKALAQYIIYFLKHDNNEVTVEGMNIGRWVVVATSDIIIHILHHDARLFYNLEELWRKDSQLS